MYTVNVTIDRNTDQIICHGFKSRYKYLYLNRKSDQLNGIHKDAKVVISGLLGQRTLKEVRTLAECAKNTVSVVIEIEAIKRCAEDVAQAAFHMFEVMSKQQVYEASRLPILSNDERKQLRLIAGAIQQSDAIRYQYFTYRAVTENLNKQILSEMFNHAMKIISETDLLPILLQSHSLREEIEAAQRYFSKEQTLAQINKSHEQSLEASRKHLYRLVLKLDDIHKAYSNG